MLLADDHTIVRTGLRLLLERQPDMEVVAEASDGRQTVELTEAKQPDVAVIDITMPLLNGIEAARQINASLPQTRVIMLSMHSDESYVAWALQVGIRGYLLKDSTDTDLVNAIHAVHAGKAFFSPEVSRLLVENYTMQMQHSSGHESYELLSTREREVLQLLAEGKSGKESAGILNVSLSTVETHRNKIFKKLNLQNLPELILYAVRRGLI